MEPLVPPPQTSVLNKHLQELMDGLTAKVFRTYNASITLQQQLKELTSGTMRKPVLVFFFCLGLNETQTTPL